MLTIEYDPINGSAVPDGKAVAFATEAVNAHQMSPRDETVVISNELVVDAFRVLVVRKVIHHTDIQFKYKNIIIRACPTGQLDAWPDGFCSNAETLLLEMLNAE